MRTTVIALTFFLSSISLFSRKQPFKAVRVTADFKDLVTNGSNFIGATESSFLKDPYYLSSDKEAVISSHIFNDTCEFLLIDSSHSRKEGIAYKINPLKIFRNFNANSINEPTIEEEKVFLRNFAPYPLPGKNVIQCKIFWNRNYPIENVVINIYGVYGTSMQSQKVKINKVLDYMGILEWDCSDAPSGIYVVQVILAGETLSFPVMVLK